MGGSAQQLPTRFPCWCKAVYSWGGETSKDLGFIEGDLIECLNAGDGSWWMGRLRRDRRMVGLFPSNFVQLLGENFQPAPISRNMSPMTSANQTQTTPHKAKSVFRKPFQGYKEFGYRDDGCNSQASTPEHEKPQKKKFAPYSSMKTVQAPGSIKKPNSGSAGPSPLKEEPAFRMPSPPPRGGNRGSSRAPSPLPPATRPASPSPSPAPSAIYRGSSPAPMQSRHNYNSSAQQQAMYRPVSPAPSVSQYRPHSPRPFFEHSQPPVSPQGMYRASSPAPYTDPYYSRAPSPQPPQHYQQPARTASPQPPPAPAESSSSPPPPPPPHRVAYHANRLPSPAPYEDDLPGEYGTPARNTANVQSSGMTPSPLRDAMNDVMSSLHDMSSIAGRSSPRPQTPPNVWSPDAFDLIRTKSAHHQMRAQSALDMRRPEPDYQNFHHGYDEASIPSLPASRDGPPAIDNYVQRMEHRLRHAQSQGTSLSNEYSTNGYSDRPVSRAASHYSGSRPTTSSSHTGSDASGRFSSSVPRTVAPRKSAHELGRQQLSRTYTTKTSVTSSSSGAQSCVTNSTQSSNSTALTSHSIMSGHSAGAFSATSAGSFARRRFGNQGSMKMKRPLSALSSRSNGDMRQAYQNDGRKENRPPSEFSGVSYHSSHATQPEPTPVADWTRDPMENAGVLGGLAAPKAKKSGFFKKMIETAKTTAKTGAANARSTIGSTSRPGSRASSPIKRNMIPDGVTAIAGGTAAEEEAQGTAAHNMGLSGSDWMQVRRDVNRSNSLSRNERTERIERCEMLDILVMNPIDELMEHVEGDEGLDGLAITEPTDFNTTSLALVDKSTRFVAAVPPMITAQTLAQNYLCRPYRSDVQRLRAIFTWVAERITWEEDFEGEIDVRRVIQTRRGCSEEIAVLVRDMCSAVGLHAEVVRGYLKAPGELLDLDAIARPNHYWNAVIVDGEWRVMDCSLAGPTNPRRSAYSSANSNVAEPWYFLARPMETCYTHVPLLPEQQHIVPPAPHEVLMSLPCACPPYFRHHVEVANFDTSMLHLEGLEMAHMQISVPEDVECVAEVEARAFARDMDGDLFESGDLVRKSALAQVNWLSGRKYYMVKAILPGDEGQGVLKIYAGKRGLMHSIKDNPHSLALAIPLFHAGQNPPYTFLTRHPTPHAQRHDLYVAQPQCARLVMNNTFVFAIRQHPSSLSRFSPDTWGSSSAANAAAGIMRPTSGMASRSNSALSILPRPTSPLNPLIRPTSAMSMISAAASNSNYSDNTTSTSSSAANAAGLTDKQQKPAKLAMQSPSGKIIRFTRKQNLCDGEESAGWGSTWETVIKVGERGVWRGLVLADRSARWCVFAEWECV